MKARTAAICVALGLAFSPLAGYAADKDAPKKEGVMAKTKEALTDAEITTKIKAEYAKDKAVSAMKIHVDTDKGVVKLTGNAKTKGEADKAVTIAKDTKGVSSVVNEIKIGGEGMMAKTKEAVTDAEITTKIKAEYAKDKAVSAMKIHVDTDKGVVKLTGTAKTKGEADKAVTIAKGTKGVSSVVNEIKIGGKS